MKKDHNITGYSSRFNVHGLSEIIVGFDAGDQDSMMISDFDVQLESGEWKDMRQAFKDKDLITDNYNTMFAEPKNAEERARGWW